MSITTNVCGWTWTGAFAQDGRNSRQFEFGGRPTARRGWFLTVAAILFGLLALSNFLKPVLANANTGFVFLGHRLSGLSNDILGPVFGIILVFYVIAIWQMRRFAMPLGWAYAAYVVVNMTLFGMTTTDKPPSPPFMIATLVVGLGVPIGAAIVLTQRRASLT